MAPEGEEGDDKLFWEDDQTWSFSVLESEQNCGKKFDIEINLEEEKAEKVDDHEKPPPPPPPPAAKGKKRSVAAGKGGGGGGGEGKGVGESDHEVHIWTERERRKKMRNMFANLHSLLPNLPPKADKSTIVDEAVQYITKLQQNLDSLQKQKLERVQGISSKSLINYNFSLSTQQKLEIPSREAFLAELGSKSGNSTPVSLASPNSLFAGPEFPAIFKTWTSPNVVVNVSGRDAHISICGPKKARLFTGICLLMEKYQLEVVSAQVSADRNRCMCMIHTHANGASDVFPMAAFPVEEIYKQAAAEIMLWVSS